jgi:cobalt-zinc-cadmium efflux system protein
MSSDHSSGFQRKRVLLLTGFLNLGITVVEGVGGWLSGSLSLFSDAIHNFGDTLALFLAFLAIHLSKGGPNFRNTFGYKRAEILAALFNALLLIGSSLFLMGHAVVRFFEPQVLDAGLMGWVAVVGLLANLGSVYLLHRFRLENLNIRAAYLHLLGDSFSSLAVVIGALVMGIWGWFRVDAMLTLGICIFILFETLKILRESLAILLQNIPPGLNLKKLQAEVEDIPGIMNIHHIHAWQLTDQAIHLDFHAMLQVNIQVGQTSAIHLKVEQLLKDRYDVQHLTIQFEYETCHQEVGNC